MNNASPLQLAFSNRRGGKIAAACCVSRATAHGWRSDDRLPQSDLSGLTDYAGRIAEICAKHDVQVTRADLIEHTRAAWLRRARAASDAA